MPEDRVDPRAWRPAWAAPTGCLAIMAGCAGFAGFAGITVVMLFRGLVWLSGFDFARTGMVAIACIAIAHVSAIALWFRWGRLRVMTGIVIVALATGYLCAVVQLAGFEGALVICALAAAHGLGFGGARLVGLGERLGSPVAWRRRRLRAGRCPLCGYDIRGFPSARCPECGDRLDFPAVAGPLPPESDALHPPVAIPGPPPGPPPVPPPVTAPRTKP